MGAYVIRRLLWIPVTIILVSMIVFLMVRFIPGTIIDLIEAEIFSLQFAGVILDRDLVKVKGEWQSSGRFRISQIENLTSKTRAR